MSQKLICDACGEPIDPATPYYTLTGQKVQSVATNAENMTPTDAVLTGVGPQVNLDYHEEHLPHYTVEGKDPQPIIPPVSE